MLSVPSIEARLRLVDSPAAREGVPRRDHRLPVQGRVSRSFHLHYTPSGSRRTPSRVARRVRRARDRDRTRSDRRHGGGGAAAPSAGLALSLPRRPELERTLRGGRSLRRRPSGKGARRRPRRPRGPAGQGVPRSSHHHRVTRSTRLCEAPSSPSPSSSSSSPTTSSSSSGTTSAGTAAEPIRVVPEVASWSWACRLEAAGWRPRTTCCGGSMRHRGTCRSTGSRSPRSAARLGHRGERDRPGSPVAKARARRARRRRLAFMALRPKAAARSTTSVHQSGYRSMSSTHARRCAPS